MDYFVDASKIAPQQMEGYRYLPLLGPENGCTGCCLTGISIYTCTRYPEPQAHPFQEGFYVIEGEGFAMVGDQEFPVRAGTSFLAPAGLRHAVRCKRAGHSVRIFWFHSA